MFLRLKIGFSVIAVLATFAGAQLSVATVRVPALYPVEAAKNCIEGWVLLGFTVTAEGEAEDVRVLDSEPPGVFDEAAIVAFEQMKILLRIRSDAVAVTEAQYKLAFELDDALSHCSDT